jgi:putative phosphoesterase
MEQQRKTKILAASDIHGNKRTIERLAKQAEKENVDLIILAGDITMFEMETKGLISPFTKLKKPVLIMPGNHESPELIEFLSEKYPHTKNIHRYSFQVYDLGIFGVGGADFGLTTMNDEEFFSNLHKAHERIKSAKKKLMVTHMHPYKSQAEFSGIIGSKGIRKAIKELNPDIAIAGHIHEAEGLEEKIYKTRFMSIGKKGKIIEI